jgi:type IV pilus assembly protein PilN
MIKINLLGDDTAVDTSGKFFIVGYLASLVLCVAIFVWLNQTVRSDLVQLQGEAEDLQRSNDALSVQTKEVTELQKKRDVLNSKLALIARLKKSKIGPVRVLDDLNNSVPDKVWLRQIIEKDGVMRIKGRALTDQDIVVFLENLKKSNYFESVDLVESQQMFYSKRTGQVSPTPDIEKLRGGSPDFRAESRVTKESRVKPSVARKGAGAAAGKGGSKKWSVRDGSAGNAIADRSKSIDDFNVKIKEFIISAQVNYAGKIKAAEAVENPPSSQPVREKK